MLRLARYGRDSPCRKAWLTPHNRRRCAIGKWGLGVIQDRGEERRMDTTDTCVRTSVSDIRTRVAHSEEERRGQERKQESRRHELSGTSGEREMILQS